MALASVVDEVDQVDVWIRHVLAVPAYPVVGIELTYRSPGGVIAALALVVLRPPEVFSGRPIGFLWIWLLTFVLVANSAVVHVYAFATLDGAGTAYTHGRCSSSQSIKFVAESLCMSSKHAL